MINLLNLKKSQSHIFTLLIQAQIGVVFNPITNELYHAVKGQGAYVNGKTLKHSGQKGAT